MSKTAEGRYWARVDQHILECQETMKIGTKVWLAEGFNVLEGTVIDIKKGYLDSGGWPKEDPSSERYLYIARFPFKYGDVWQEYQVRFFHRKGDAQRRVAVQYNRGAEDHERTAAGWRKKANELIEEAKADQSDWLPGL